MVNQQDFQYMWQGKATRELSDKEASLLTPIYIESKQKKCGRALLLIHGFASSPAMYRALHPMLKNYDALVCPALPGHAENHTAFSSVTFNEWQKHAKDTCEALTRQYEHVEVVGLSLGGVLAYQIAHILPIKKLYLLAPAFKLRLNIPLAKTLGYILHAIGMRSINNRGGNLYTHEYEELTYKKLPIHAIFELFKLIKSSSHSTLPCPTDLFLGVHDNVVDSDYLANVFDTNSLCTIHWLDRSAHALPLDGNIDFIARCINRYKWSPVESA